MPPIAQHPDVVSRLALLRNWAETQVAANRIRGFSVAIVYGNELVFADGFGVADRDETIASTASTAYPIGSIGGLFAACAVLLLVDEDVLALDDPINTYLPGFSVKTRFIGARQLTIRDLVSRTSGLPRDLRSGSVGVESSAGDFEIGEALLRRLAEEEVLYAPGTTWHYSNVDLDLLGEVVASATGNTYVDFVSRTFLTPLDMANTTPATPVVRGYRSTVLDLARFLSWQLRLLDAGADEILGSDSLAMAHDPSSPAGNAHGQGLVFVTHELERRTVVGHDSVLDRYTGAAYVSPAERVGLVLLANSDSASVAPVSDWSITARIFEWLAPSCVAAAERREPSSFDPDLRRFEGTYVRGSTREVYQVLDGALRNYRPSHVDPLADALPLERRNDTTFVFVGKDDRYLDGEPVVFELPESGSATGLTIGVDYWRRADQSATPSTT